MNYIQLLTAAIWHDLTCTVCRNRKGYKRMSTKSYRSQAIHRRKQLQKKLHRRQQIINFLKDTGIIFGGLLFLWIIAILAAKP